MKYQKCPCCDGSGIVSRPAYIPTDQPEFFTGSTSIWPCKRCNGTGTILEPTQCQSDTRDTAIKIALNYIEMAQETLNPDRDIPCDDQAWIQLEIARKALAAWEAQK